MAMTEIDLSDSSLPSVTRFQLDGSTANQAHQLNIIDAETATKMTLRFEGADGKVAFVTAADAIHANHIAVTKDSTVEFSIAPTKRGNRVSVIYVASATVGTYVSVILEAGA
jgi:hypothetical protein